MAQDIYQESLNLHRNLQGKIEVISRVHINDEHDLALVYTPGVAEACRVIEKNEEESFDLTRCGHLVAVITDGSAVLGLGNIGPSAGMPVMEGKCALFKEFGDVDAIPLCIDTQDSDEIVETVARIAKSFGGINLEDIAAPRCFEIERKLQERLDIPVFHDDQHGTAIVVAAALLNAYKLLGKKMGETTIVINGCGAAGCAIADLLLDMGFGNLICCGSKGILDSEDETLNFKKRELAERTNVDEVRGTLADAMKGADVFIGVSRGNLVTPEMVQSMNDGIVFALANPIPEIYPDEALAAGAKIAATGRSDYPNQINNVLVFPGIFKGALKARAKKITRNMEIAAAYAIASKVDDAELRPDHIIVSALNKSVANVVAEAVERCALEEAAE